MNFYSQASFKRRFGGIERLYGSACFERFTRASVCVVGLGGVGSWAVEALVRSGVGKITLIDLDNVAESNVNRQLHAINENIGKPKIQAMCERIFSIQNQCEVTTVEDFVDENNLSKMFDEDFDFVIDAIDQMRVKAAMADYFVRRKQAFAVSGGAGGQRLPEKIRYADLSDVRCDKLLANMRYRLRRYYDFPKQGKMRVPCVYSEENTIPPQNASNCDAAPQGLSCAGYGAVMTVTATFGMFLANAALEHIASLPEK
ncbi:MAG: tRNA threonylcarbamoyladenosine dehydratase [Neisseriaceae bacterium]|nr:tRNA threonylcarbamoyladenosine dehydratase [Neisseriaceae bacterium]